MKEVLGEQGWEVNTGIVQDWILVETLPLEAYNVECMPTRHALGLSCAAMAASAMLRSICASGQHHPTWHMDSSHGDLREMYSRDFFSYTQRTVEMPLGSL